jgi:hypothetical protein
MPSPELSHRKRDSARAEYYYRRQLSARELLPAIGVAVAAGVFAFYVTRILLQKTPLTVQRTPRLVSDRKLAARIPSGTRSALSSRRA